MPFESKQNLLMSHKRSLRINPLVYFDGKLTFLKKKNVFFLNDSHGFQDLIFLFPEIVEPANEFSFSKD